MKFTAEEIEQMVAEDRTEGEACARLAGVITELLAELRKSNEKLAELAGREQRAPTVNVAAAAAPNIKVEVAAPKVDVTIAAPKAARRVINITATEREKDGPNRGLVKRWQIEEWEPNK